LAEVIKIDNARRRLAARRGFQSWSRMFDEAFDDQTRLADLSDAALGSLIQAGDQTTLVIHDFIMGVKNLGRGAEFNALDNSRKMAVMDIAIFLLDQLRFECMRRLGWVSDYDTKGIPLVDLVSQFSSSFAAAQNRTPALAPSHPLYGEYLKEFDLDRSAFLRRLIPVAIETFQKRLSRG
jgi:hypothetical protein